MLLVRQWSGSIAVQERELGSIFRLRLAIVWNPLQHELRASGRGRKLFCACCFCISNLVVVLRVKGAVAVPRNRNIMDAMKQIYHFFHGKGSLSTNQSVKIGASGGYLVLVGWSWIGCGSFVVFSVECIVFSMNRPLRVCIYTLLRAICNICMICRCARVSQII